MRLLVRKLARSVAWGVMRSNKFNLQQKNTRIFQKPLVSEISKYVTVKPLQVVIETEMLSNTKPTQV